MSNIRIVWNDGYHKHFRQRYNHDTGQWEFLDWNVSRRDSVLPNQGNLTSSWNDNQQGSGAYTAAGAHEYQHHTQHRSRLPRGEGPYITGSYTGQNLHYEELDPSYVVRSSDFFFEGRVFAVMWNETASASARPVDYNTSLSEVKYSGNFVHTNVRRFIVVRRKHEFCFACPIFTYSGRATTKSGVRASEHAVAYSWPESPTLLPGETGITKRPIPVVTTAGAPPLAIESRIYFGIHHPVQYNVKVKEMGYVPQDHIPTLIGNWREESEGTNQSLEVTVNAGQEELDEDDAYHPQGGS